MSFDRIALMRAGALVSYFGLLILVVAGIALLAPPQYVPQALVLLAFGLPLLLPLRGLLHGRPRAHVWCALLALFYFAYGMYHGAAPGPGRLLGWAQAGLAVMLFVSSALYARWRHREVVRLESPATTARLSAQTPSSGERANSG